MHFSALYRFLRYCNESPLEKKILDCGAGWEHPPLATFYQAGYETYGIEIAEDSLAEALKFCREKKLPLNIIRADMRHIPFADDSFSFVYSYNAIFFMTKPDIALSMSEIERVLKPEGLCFVNFMSVDDPDRRTFCETAFARRLLNSRRFAHFEDNEADKYFASFEILYKEKRLIDKLFNNERLKQARVEYIARKRKTA